MASVADTEGAEIGNKAISIRRVANFSSCYKNWMFKTFFSAPNKSLEGKPYKLTPVLADVGFNGGGGMVFW